MPDRICPICKTQAEATTVFCEHCGLRLPTGENHRAEPASCPACGQLNLPGETFCQKCGVVLAPIAGKPPPLPRPLDSLESLPKSAQRTALAEGRKPNPPVPAPPVSTHNQESLPNNEPIRGCLRHRETGRVLPFPPGIPRLLVGRADAADEFFPDIDLEPLHGEQMGVSRRHALLTAHQGHVYIEDLNSTNFTFLNNMLIPPSQSKLLHHGDIVQLGQLVLIYEEIA
jgi:hypothetical protein